MPTRYQPALDLHRAFARGEARLPHLGPRHRGLGRRARQRRRQVDRHPARLARHRRNHAAAPRPARGARRRRRGPRASRRSTCSAWAAAACAPRCCAASSAWPRARRSCYVLDTTDEQTITNAAGAADARAHLVPGRQQERRHGRSRVDGAVLLVARPADARRARPAASSSPSPIPAPRSRRWPARAATARSSSTRPTSAAASPRCRCSGWCRRR